MVSGEAFDFSYDARHRLSAATRNGTPVATYSYNALGQRVHKVASYPASGDRRYLYDEAGHLLAEYGDSNRDYIWMGDVPVAVVDIGGGLPQISYLVSDGLGTPRVATDAAGTPIWQWRYAGNPFGEQAPTVLNGSNFALNLRFPGQYADTETGLYYNVNRDYEPAVGRYVQSDPIGLNGGISTYAYVGGNPLTRTDPTGLACNGQGCWNTAQERAYAQAGDWKNYYATACANRDPYACAGGNVANNVVILSSVTNYRLASYISSRLPPGKTCAADQALIDQNMEKIREALAAARAAQLDAAGASPDNPVMVTGQSISAFHNDIFKANGGGPVFGGDVPGANQIMWLHDQVFGGPGGWCVAPACRP